MKIKGVATIFFIFLLRNESVKTMRVIKPVAIPGDPSRPQCPTEEQRANTLQVIQNDVNNHIYNVMTIQTPCGVGDWERVAFINMSDPLQHCPSNWAVYVSNGIRACGRPNLNVACQGVFFPISTGQSYSKVCGRAIGYEYGGQEAFEHTNINSNYVYGLSITHGIPRSHIWTYAVGNTEGDHSVASWNCPCADPDHPSSDIPPSFVGDDFYCESGNPTNTWSPNRFYPNDPLWDGEDCEGTCCSNGKTPPWFSVDLPNPTSDSIEVRICTAEGGSDTKVQLLEILVA